MAVSDWNAGLTGVRRDWMLYRALPYRRRDGMKLFYKGKKNATETEGSDESYLICANCLPLFESNATYTADFAFNTTVVAQSVIRCR